MPPHEQLLNANPVLVTLTRLACGWPKAQLAETAGVSPAHVGKVEAGMQPLTGKPLLSYAEALGCPPAALCAPYRRAPAEGAHPRLNANAAEWERDRIVARANLIAMRLGRIAECVDIHPPLALPNLDPQDYAPQSGEITVARVLRRLWRLAGPIRSMTELLEAAGVFIVMEDFRDHQLAAVTLRADEHHPTLVYVNAALPPDRMRMAIAHELGHLVMDARTLASPAETETRAAGFAAEFLAPSADIAFDLDRVSARTIHELDELRITWGVSAVSLTERARERGALTDREYRSLLRLLNETDRADGHQPGPATEQPTLVGRILAQCASAGYTDHELDEISLLTRAQRAALFQVAGPRTGSRHLASV